MILPPEPEAVQKTSRKFRIRSPVLVLRAGFSHSSAFQVPDHTFILQEGS
jgi:hypothetical protein